MKLFFNCTAVLAIALLSSLNYCNGQVAISSMATPKSGTANTSLSVACETTSLQMLLIVHYTGFNYVTASYKGLTSSNIGNIAGGNDHITLFQFTASATGIQTIDLSVVGSSGSYYAELLALKNTNNSTLSITTTSGTGSGGSVSSAISSGDMLIGGIFGDLGTISNSSTVSSIQNSLSPEFTSPYTGMDSYVSSSKLNWTSSVTCGASYTAWALHMKSASPLPISLLNFDAQYISEKNTVNINWSTATETNNKLFTIEKTTDGINYTTVATVAGAGNSDNVLYYNTTDESPWGGTTYYRLKQTDFDGNFTYSDIVMVNVPLYYSVNIYPNPVTDHIVINYNADSPNPVTVKMFNLSGMLVNSFDFAGVQAGDNNFTINTSYLQAGMYIMELTSGDQVTRRKFIKE